MQTSVVANGNVTSICAISQRVNKIDDVIYVVEARHVNCRNQRFVVGASVCVSVVLFGFCLLIRSGVCLFVCLFVFVLSFVCETLRERGIECC